MDRTTAEYLQSDAPDPSRVRASNEVLTQATRIRVVDSGRVGRWDVRANAGPRRVRRCRLARRVAGTAYESSTIPLRSGIACVSVKKRSSCTAQPEESLRSDFTTGAEFGGKRGSTTPFLRMACAFYVSSLIVACRGRSSVMSRTARGWGGLELRRHSARLRYVAGRKD